MFVGYLVCFTIALLWMLRAFTDRFKPEAAIMGGVYLLILGLIPVSLVVISVSIVTVVTRKQSVWLHIGASTAMSLMVPSIAAVFLTTPPQGRPGQFVPFFFVPPVCAALSMVWATRKLFRIKGMSPHVAEAPDRVMPAND
jgi:hypothetical protein